MRKTRTQKSKPKDGIPSAFHCFGEHIVKQGRSMEEASIANQWSWYHAGWSKHRQLLENNKKEK
jgi:hypothetical protein